LLLSAHTADSLRKRIGQIIDYAKNYPDRLHDLSYTLATRRSPLPHRAFAVVQPNNPVLDDTAFSIFNDSSPNVTFVFTGQGAQWPGMGLRLLSTFPKFKQDIKAMDEALQQLPDGPNWLLYGQIEDPTPKRGEYLD
jgi:acyl transferase domain-containing protein